MKLLQKERNEISKKMSQAQWDIQTKKKEIIKLTTEIEELTELVDFYDRSLK